MNEQELVEIWKSSARSEPIDFEQVQQSLDNWQEKLRKKIKVDIGASIIALVVAGMISFVLPKLLYFLPFIALMMLSGFWKLWKVPQTETTAKDSKSTRVFLEEKIVLLKKYIRWVRIIIYTTSPLFALVSILLQVSVKYLLEDLMPLILILVLAEVFAIAFCEVYFKFMYMPFIKRYQQLLEQLESD